MPTVAVTSRSFSNNVLLRNELLQRYPQTIFNETQKTLKGNELIDFLHGHEMTIVGLEKFDATTLAQLPNLKVISRFGVGIDTIDIDALNRLGIRLAYTANANKRSVAELVIAFAINMLRQLPRANLSLRSGLWEQCVGRQLSHKIVGIIGLGAIGKDLSLLLKSFECDILAYDLLDQTDFCSHHHIVQTDLENLLTKAEIISIHLPLNTTTASILNNKRLALIKPNAILINTARGGLVDEEAIKNMLKHGKLAGAAFDVFLNEPPSDEELLSHPHFFATPHLAGSTEEAIIAIGRAAIEGLEKAVIPLSIKGVEQTWQKKI